MNQTLRKGFRGTPEGAPGLRKLLCGAESTQKWAHGRLQVVLEGELPRGSYGGKEGAALGLRPGGDASDRERDWVLISYTGNRPQFAGLRMPAGQE